MYKKLVMTGSEMAKSIQLMDYRFMDAKQFEELKKISHTGNIQIVITDINNKVIVQSTSTSTAIQKQSFLTESTNESKSE